MIYHVATDVEPIDQGDLIEDCPTLALKEVDLDAIRPPQINVTMGRVLQSPYREHLAKHFADTFSRIGLPEPYESEP